MSLRNDEGEYSLSKGKGNRRVCTATEHLEGNWSFLGYELACITHTNLSMCEGVGGDIHGIQHELHCAVQALPAVTTVLSIDGASMDTDG